MGTVCRFCLCENDELLIPASSLIDSVLTVQKIEQFTGIFIGEAEHAPYTICVDCNKHLRKCVEFRTSCLTNDVLFRQLYAALIDNVCKGEETIEDVLDDLITESPQNAPVAAKFEIIEIKEYKAEESEASLEKDSFHEIGETIKPEDDDSFSVDQEESDNASLANDKNTATKSNLEVNSNEETVKTTVLKKNRKKEANAPIQAVRTSRRTKPTKSHTEAGSSNYRDCDTCGKTVSDIRSHMLTHTQEKKFSCPYCSVKMTLKSNINVHIRSVHLKQVSKTCDVCGQQFVNYNSYKHHMAAQHGTGEYECATCSKHFTHIRSYKIHIRRYHNTEVANQMKEKKRQLCGICGAMVTQIASHILTHTQEKKFACPLCPIRMTDQANLTRHVKSVHLKNNVKSCDKCGKGFKYNSSYRSHMLSQHGIGKTFDCNICAKKFNHLHSLKIHVARLHTNETKFHCTVCGMQFKVKSSLVKHQQVHTPDQPYACNQCPKRFKSRHGRNAHQLTHSGITFPCPHCDKSYRYKDVLTMHIRQNHAEQQSDNKAQPNAS